MKRHLIYFYILKKESAKNILTVHSKHSNKTEAFSAFDVSEQVLFEFFFVVSLYLYSNQYKHTCKRLPSEAVSAYSCHTHRLKVAWVLLSTIDSRLPTKSTLVKCSMTAHWTLLFENSTARGVYVSRMAWQIVCDIIVVAVKVNRKALRLVLHLVLFSYYTKITH